MSGGEISCLHGDPEMLCLRANHVCFVPFVFLVKITSLVLSFTPPCIMPSWLRKIDLKGICLLKNTHCLIH